MIDKSALSSNRRAWKRARHSRMRKRVEN